MRYLISYDLVTPGKNYEPLWKALRELRAVRILESEWLVSRDKTNPLNLANYVLTFMDANDRIFVTEVPDSYAYRTLLADPKAA
jgi:hypothetical protein